MRSVDQFSKIMSFSLDFNFNNSGISITMIKSGPSFIQNGLSFNQNLITSRLSMVKRLKYL